MKANNDGDVPVRWYRVGPIMLLLLAVHTSAVAEGQKANPCEDWRQGASETMFRISAAQSRAEEGIKVILGIKKGERDVQGKFERERKRFERAVEEAVTASRLAIQESEQLTQRLKEAKTRCPEAELHGIRWAQWWFDNHGPIVMMRAGYLAAARLDFPRAESIFEQIIVLSRSSDNPNYAGMMDRAKRSLEIVKMGKVPFVPHERKYQKEHNPGKVPPPEYVPRPTGGKP